MRVIRKGVVLAVLAVVAAAMCLPAAAAPGQAEDAGAGKVVVCLDPGHGGADSGAVGNGLQEKVLNLDIALRARAGIEAAGYRVVMTRTTDATLSLEERCQIANRSGAAIFVSVHNNAYESSSNGTETFCYYSSADGRALATCIHQEVVKRARRKDRGVKEAGFYVLHHTDMTAALVEGAFLTNVEDAKCLAKPSFRQAIADGIAAGVQRYLKDPGRFEEYILLMNPDREKAAELELSFMRGDGVVQRTRREVEPGSRMTMRVDDFVYNADVSTLVTSTNEVPVVAERAQYFDFDRGRGGHGSPGVTTPAYEWHLAEGSTDWGFSTFILVQNPGKERNSIVAQFMRSDGVSRRYRYNLAPRSRFTLDCRTVPGFEKADFSVKLTADDPVVAERAMYFQDHWGISGGHDSPGVSVPSRRWYLAEGYTGPGFHSYVLLENPNAAAVKARLSYLLPKGKTRQGYVDLAPRSRKTIYLNAVEGLKNTDVSVRVDASGPVVAERSMYFDYSGVREGSNSIGATAPSRQWYLAEGYTGNGFDTYVLLMNPADVPSSTTMRFMRSDGRVFAKNLTLPARSRTTVWLNKEKNLSSAEVSTFVQSEQPIVAERSMYFLAGAKIGGHCAIGVTGPALQWYFAEGCTR